jgi:precorrin-6Y C5,15-methyltransferase (decarboxylating)
LLALLMEDPNTTGAAPEQPWLSIVGIGEDGVDALTSQARGLIESAVLVFGGQRHLKLAASVIRGDTRAWGSPFTQSVTELLAHRGRPICVLASGDPFMHGVGSILARYISPEETLSLPAPSAFSLAASRLLWALPETTLVSLCGRSPDLIRPHLQPGARVMALTSDSNSPIALASLLCTLGFGNSRLTVLEALGGPRERIRTATAKNFNLDAIDSLNTLAIDVLADVDARVLPRAPGLPDEMFEHDGQISKREIRALTLSALAPRRGEHLWDIGAGSGSVAIEWMLSDTSLSAVAIERRHDRAERIKRNAATLGVPDLEVIEADAPAAFEGLRSPDAAFIGGGATPSVIDAVQLAVRSKGRVVVNAITLETEAVILRKQAQVGGALTRIQVSRAGPVGGENSRLSGWRPAMPVTQWTWVKP